MLAGNAKDVTAARHGGRPESFVDRLLLDEKRIEAIAKGLEDVAALADPVGTVLAEWERPNGLRFQRVRVPLGVIGIIYESRPNVTADAGALCLKSGNAAILRGGSESHHSSRAIHACVAEGLKAAGLPETAIQLVPTTDREAVGHMLRGLGGSIDVIVVMYSINVFLTFSLSQLGMCVHWWKVRAGDPEWKRHLAVNGLGLA